MRVFQNIIKYKREREKQREGVLQLNCSKLGGTSKLQFSEREKVKNARKRIRSRTTTVESAVTANKRLEDGKRYMCK